MRINSVTVRNYRLLREQTVEFDNSLTLVGGLNATGKSTLIEAIHRALFLKARGNTEYHRAMISSLHSGTPEVELTFESNGKIHVLKKQFGPHGTVTLAASHSPPLSGDQAEAELARLINVEEGLAGKAMTTQWSHLWVWQGQAGNDPSAHATAQKDGLFQRLQETGGAAALQSDLDARVARHFADAVDQIYTSNGKPKAGSELKRAEEVLDLANQEFERARDQVQKLDTAAKNLENARHDCQAAETSLGELEKQQLEVESRAQQLQNLRQQEAEQQPAVQTACDRHSQLEAADKQIHHHRHEVSTLQETLQPQHEAIGQLEKSTEDARQETAKAEHAYRQATDLVRTTRLRRDLALAFPGLFEKTEHHRKLSEKKVKVTSLKSNLTELENEVAKLPKVDNAGLQKLRKLETECSNASAALQAMATGLEVIAADKPVVVGDQPLGVGQKQILTESTEVSLGSAVRLRIQPGGGTSLADARKKELEARTGLQKALDAVTLASVGEAAEVHSRLEQLRSDIKTITAELDGMGADTLDEDMRAAETELTAAKTNLERLAGLVTGVEPPGSMAAAKALAQDWEKILSEAEDQEKTAKASYDRCAEKLASAEEKLNEKRVEMQKNERTLNDLKAQLDLLVNTHGDDAARSQALVNSKIARTTAQNALNAIHGAIAALQADLLEADRTRIKRAIETKKNERHEAQTRIAVAQNVLRSDGTEDPQASLAAAEAKVRSAKLQHNGVQRNAQAMVLLNRLFQEEQRAMVERFTRPLADKISGYVQCILGPAARAQVELEDHEFTSLRLSQPEDGGIAYLFGTLSGGTKEQLAAAVRLAMAEVLAADHGGCLPVVFDDAFTNSDPERVKNAQRMLYLAATRGLQVIVLTCNPADYTALGAKHVVLRRERNIPTSPTYQVPGFATKVPGLSKKNQDTDPAGPIDQAPGGAAAPAVTDELRQELLARLKALGGSKGNQALREDLGWEQATYAAVKDDLVAAGMLITHRGRGGSVSLKP